MATKNNPEDYDLDVDAHDNVSPQPGDVHDDHDSPPPAEVLTTTKARRLVRELHKSAKDAMMQLQSLKAGKTVELTTLALDALVCGAHHLKYPLDDSDLDALEMFRDRRGTASSTTTSTLVWIRLKTSSRLWRSPGRP